MEEKVKTTPPDNIDVLTLWDGDKGRLAVSIKNGYPRFTYFFKGPEKKFISAPMNMKYFGLVARMIKTAALNKGPIKIYLDCYNNMYDRENPDNKPTIGLQSILVVAKLENDDIVLGIKKDKTSPAFTAKIQPSKWNVLRINDEESTNATQIVMEALSYSDIIYNIVATYTKQPDNIPNSKREIRSEAPKDLKGLDEYGDNAL